MKNKWYNDRNNPKNQSIKTDANMHNVDEVEHSSENSSDTDKSGIFYETVATD